MLLLLLLLPSATLCLALHRLYFHPLAHVPGPRLAAVSSLWYAYQVRNGRLLRLARTLHQTYGPAVRVRPNEVWFDAPEAFQVIYSSRHGFAKSNFYLATALFRPRPTWRRPRPPPPDTLDLLSERDMDRYRVQRRLIGPVYHEANLHKFADPVDAVLRRAVAELRALPPGADVDLKEWMHLVVLECLGAVVLSWSPGLLAAHSDRGTSRVGYANWRRKSVLGLFPALVVADAYAPWLTKAFAAVWRLRYDLPPDFRSFFPQVGQRVSARIRQARKSTSSSPKNDLMADLLRLHSTRPTFSETDLRRMAVTNFGAGHETMCSALTAAIAMLGSHPDVFRRVAHEVRSASSATTAQVRSAREAAVHLPQTWAAIREAQRLHPALAMSLPRVVPLHGADLLGYRLPPGTVVGCSPPALHRNESIFGPDADAFRPARWLDDGDTARRRAMTRFNLTWGGGPRTCPGRYLAELILHKAVVALVREFDVHVTMPADDDIHYYFLAMLTGTRARFVARTDELHSLQG